MHDGVDEWQMNVASKWLVTRIAAEVESTNADGSAVIAASWVPFGGAVNLVTRFVSVSWGVRPHEVVETGGGWGRRDVEHKWVIC